MISPLKYLVMEMIGETAEGPSGQIVVILGGQASPIEISPGPTA